MKTSTWQPQYRRRARDRSTFRGGYMLHKYLLTHLQVAGMEISLPALSLLEGQERPVSDIEFKALAEILNVDVRWLLGQI